MENNTESEEQSSAGVRSSTNSDEVLPESLWKTIALIFWTHLRRCFGWRLLKTEPTPYELNMFDKAQVQDPTLRTYLAWRRSQMMFSVPVLLSSAFTGLSAALGYDEEGEDKEYLDDRGNFIYKLPNIANFILLVAVMGAIGFPKGRLRVWPKWRLSSKILRVGFIISFILPIIPALIPLEFISKSSSSSSSSSSEEIINDAFPGADVIEFISNSSSNSNEIMNDALSDADAINDMAQQRTAMQTTVTVGIQNFISALPVLVSFPSSLLAGSLRIRGLLPDSTLSSWILVTTAPFLSIVMMAVSILIIQFGGDVALMIGVFLRCFYPWMYVFRRGLYVKAASEEREKKVDCNQHFMSVINLVSISLIVKWLFTQDLIKSGEAINYAKLLLEIWGRYLATTVVFTDVLLRMTVTNWRVEKSIRNLDAEYESIERGIRSKKKLREDDASNEMSATVEGLSQSIEDVEEGINKSDNISSGEFANDSGKTAPGSPEQGMDKTDDVQDDTLNNEIRDSIESDDFASACDTSLHPPERSSSLDSIDVESGEVSKSKEDQSDNMISSGALQAFESDISEQGNDKVAAATMEGSGAVLYSSVCPTSSPPTIDDLNNAFDIESGGNEAVVPESQNVELPPAALYETSQASVLNAPDVHARLEVLHESKTNSSPPESMLNEPVDHFHSNESPNQVSDAPNALAETELEIDVGDAIAAHRLRTEKAVAAMAQVEKALNALDNDESGEAFGDSTSSTSACDDSRSDVPDHSCSQSYADIKSDKAKLSIHKMASSQNNDSPPPSRNVSFAPVVSMANMPAATSEVFHDSRSDMDSPDAIQAGIDAPSSEPTAEATVAGPLNKIDGNYAFNPDAKPNQAGETRKSPALGNGNMREGWRMRDESDLDDELMEGLFESSLSLGQAMD
jgi:hypothetical protein